MKWSEQEVDLDAIDAYLKVLEEKDPMPEQKKPEEALAAFKAKHALLLKKVSKKHTHGKTTPAPRQNNNHRISRGLVAAVLAAALSCTVIASARGIDIFKSIARWTMRRSTPTSKSWKKPISCIVVSATTCREKRS